MNANDLLKNLTAPELNNPNFTNSFSQLISDINTNFKILAGAPFGVGGQGDSVVSYMEYLFVKSADGTLLTDIGYEVFKVLFPKVDLTRWTDPDVTERKYEDIKEIINTTYPKINNIGVLNMFDVKLDASPNGNVCEWAWCGTELIDGNHKPILPISLYQFYDQRANGLSGANDTSFEDMTASVFATLDESGNVIYKSLSIYPKLYFDRSNNYWAWMINNEKTGIKATGPQGNPGSAGSALIYDDKGQQYFYEGVYKSEQTMISENILKEGSIRFRVVNNDNENRSELYLDAYSVIGDEGAWGPSIQLFKTLDNRLIRTYFDEIFARNSTSTNPETLRSLGLPIFRVEDYNIPEGGSIGYVNTGAQIIGYHSIEPRRDNISGNEERNKLHIQPIVATDLLNKLGVPTTNTSIQNCDMQILDYMNIYINKANNTTYANIKNDSFSILNSGLLEKYTKQTIDGIEVRDNSNKSNLSSNGLLFKVLNHAYGGNIIDFESNILPTGLIAIYGSNEAHYRADRIQMSNNDNNIYKYNRITPNLLYIGDQEFDYDNFKPKNISRGFYVTGNTGEDTEEKKYRSVLYDNTGNPKKSNTSTADDITIVKGRNSNKSTADSIEIKKIDTDSTKTNTISFDSNIITDGTNTNTSFADSIEFKELSSLPKTNTIYIGGNIIEDGTKYNKSTVSSNIIEDGTKYNKSTVDNIEIKDGTNTNTIDVYSNVIKGGSFTNTIKANSNVIKNGANTNTINVYGNVIDDGTNTNTIKANSIKVENETSTNTSTASSNIIESGTKTNKSTVDNIEIKDGTNTNEITVDKIKITNSVGSVDVDAEINPYGGMLVPIGGIIMWTYSSNWMNEIPKGFIPCGSIDNIATFHNNNVAPYCEKLEDIDDQPKYVYTRDLAAQSTSATVIIRPIAAINPTLSGVYYKFNGRLVPGFPIPSYPVKLVGDTNNYDTFIYIMRVF